MRYADILLNCCATHQSNTKTENYKVHLVFRHCDVIDFKELSLSIASNLQDLKSVARFSRTRGKVTVGDTMSKQFQPRLQHRNNAITVY